MEPSCGKTRGQDVSGLQRLDGFHCPAHWLWGRTRWGNVGSRLPWSHSVDESSRARFQFSASCFRKGLTPVSIQHKTCNILGHGKVDVFCYWTNCCYLVFILEGTILGPVVNFYQFDTGMPHCGDATSPLHSDHRLRKNWKNWNLRLAHFWPGAIMEICPAAWRVEKDTWKQLPGWSKDVRLENDPHRNKRNII